MEKKTKIIGLGAIICILMLVSTNVSATIQYNSVKTLDVDEAKAKIESYMSNPYFIKMKEQGDTYFNTHYNESVKQHIIDNCSAYLLTKVLPAGYEPLCPLLADICYQTIALMLFLFGHGAVGVSMAMVAFWTVNLCGSLVTGGILSIVVVGEILWGAGFIAEIIRYVLQEGIIHDYGFIAYLIVLCCGLPVMLLLLALAIPLAYVIGVLWSMEDNLAYVLSMPEP
jgi:hypothetical protein